MTIKLLDCWNGLEAGSIISTDIPTENGLVAAKRATTDLTGGVRRYLDTMLSGSSNFTVRPLDRIAVQLDPGKSVVLTPAASVDATIEVLDDSGAVSQFIPYIAKVGVPTTVGPFMLPRRVRVASRSGVIAGAISQLHSSRPQGNTAVIVGDSNSYQNFAQGYVASAARANGVVTITFTQALSIPLYPGCPIQIVGLPDDMRGNQVVTSATTTTCSYDSPGPDVPVVPLTGTASVANLSCFMDNGWFVWGNALANQRFDLVGISAAVGRATDEMLARADEVGHINAAYAFVMGGTNDAVGGRTVASITANLQGIYEKLLASGKKLVYAMTILPLGAGNNAWSAPKTATIVQVNTWIKQYCRVTPGMQCIDVFSVIVDPVASSKGQAAAGMINSLDGLHLTQRGAYTIGKLIRDETTSIARNDFRTASNADNYGTNAASANVQDSAPWAGTGGDVSRGDGGALGPGFTGFKLGGTPGVMFAAPARADGFGFDNKADITVVAAGDGARFQGTSLTAARIPAGATVQLDVSVAVTGAAGKFKAVSHFLSMTINGVAGIISAMASGGSTGTDCIQEDFTAVLRTPAVRLPIAPAAGSITRSDCTAHTAGSMSFSAGRGQILVTP